MCFEMLGNIYFCKKHENFLCRIVINVHENNESGIVLWWLMAQPAVQRFDFREKSVTFRNFLWKSTTKSDTFGRGEILGSG